MPSYHKFVPCAEPLACPLGYRGLCHEPLNDGECDQPPDAEVHRTTLTPVPDEALDHQTEEDTDA